MLVQFTVENFASFKEANTLSMLATKRRSKNKELDEEAVFTPLPTLPLLKAAAVYGANGSGKSNLANALKFVKKLVLESSKESQAGEEISVIPFKLSTENEGKPSYFEITFIKNKTIYQYEFSADQVAIRSEKLTMRSSRSKRDLVLFVRDNESIAPSKKFPEGKGLDRKTRPNSLFLSVCANFDGVISTEVIDWFRSLRIVSGLNDSNLFAFTLDRLQDPVWNEKITSLVSKFDLGIERLVPASLQLDDDDEEEEIDGKDSKQTKKIYHQPAPSGTSRLSSYHNRFNDLGKIVDSVPFDFKKEESQGTQKLISMAAPLIATLEKPYVLVIDEFDARLHPIMSRNILNLFNSETNNRNAQLVVMTHDTNLLDKDLLRRDQVWFIEKDLYGASHMHSLVEYKIRNDAVYEKDYMNGKYGAIPLVGDIKRIIETSRSTATKKSAEV